MTLNFKQLQANNELLAESIAYLILGAKNYKELAKVKTNAKDNEKINKYVIWLDKFIANLKENLNKELKNNWINQK